MEEVRTKWGLVYMMEYPVVVPVEKAKRKEVVHVWVNIVRKFLESGREIVKVTPPDDILIGTASIGISQYLRVSRDGELVGYFRREGSIYLYRKF